MRVVFIGSGNLATHLSLAFKNEGIKVVQVFSLTLENAQLLGDKLDASYTDVIGDIDRDADMYVYALTDAALIPFLESFRLANGIHIHTAGSLDMHVFKGYVKQYGVMYPIQTFSKTKPIDFNTIPICIEANSKEVETILIGLGKTISNSIFLLNSDQRLHLHIAAVFASNFTNSMYSIAAEILEHKGIDFKIIQPLIMETASKVQHLMPKYAQTGPAQRNDVQTMNKHTEALQSNLMLKTLYEELSKTILQRQ